MTDTPRLKMTALRARQDFARLLDFRERFESYLKELADCLADGGHDLRPITESQLAMENEFPDHRHRFVIETYALADKLTPGVEQLIRQPSSYVGNFNAVRVHTALTVARFNYLIRRDLRRLAELDEQIRLMSDETTATELTGIASADRASIWKAVSKIDQVAEVVFKWGGRLIQLGGDIDRVS